MAGEREIPLQSYGPPLGLALILDGRESAQVPCYQVPGDPIQVIRPVPDGPVIVMNPSDEAINIQVAHTDDLLDLATWMIGAGGDAVTANHQVEGGKSLSLAGSTTFLGIRQTDGVSGVVRVLGLVGRGPAAMALAEPLMVQVMPG